MVLSRISAKLFSSFSYVWLACCFCGLLSNVAAAQSQVTVALTSPATQTSFTTNRSAIVLKGTASAASGIHRVTWRVDKRVDNTGAQGTASGTANWEIDNVWLAPGANEIAVTASDFAGNQQTLTLEVNYQPGAGAPQIVVTSPAAGQNISPGSHALIAWYVLGTPPSEWTRRAGALDAVINLYRNGVLVARLSDLTSGASSAPGSLFNYPAGDGYQIYVSSYEGENKPSRFIGASGVFRIGTINNLTVASDTGAIASFNVVAPNGEPSNNVTVKLGQDVNFRWTLNGDSAMQQTIDNGVGDVTGRTSKIVTMTSVGQFTYRLSAGGDVAQVTVNVTSNNLLNLPETLYNGITLSNPWPPKPAVYPEAINLPGYLQAPPSVIPINVGRQLLVDDFLVESTNLTRQFHPATMYAGNPVLKAETANEKGYFAPMAMPFSNGVFFDPADRLFKLWYMCGYRINVCYATSTDGKSWVRPSLDIVPGTNVVYKDTTFVDTYTNWIDLEEPNPARRYKMMRVVYKNPLPQEVQLHYSSDGIHWGPAVLVNKAIPTDRVSIFFNPFRKKWGVSVKEVWTSGPIRLRRYLEHEDLSFALNKIVPGNPSSAELLYTDVSRWLKADALDSGLPDHPGFNANLYALDSAPYESLMLGQMAILRGHADQPDGRPKLNEVYFGFSRDGFSWHRPNRESMFKVSSTQGSWNWGNVQPTAGGPIIVGDQMYIYFSARGGVTPGISQSNDANGATGLAIMRRDGFASLNAGSSEGTLTTRRVTFDGRYLFVNAEVGAGGSLCAEVLDENNQVIAPFSRANCQAFSGDATKRLMSWTSTA
ncbi:MAG: Ig-like domain-containing protein, partial [Acidobacteria bacterium]|nr:Ig-like domain-containing protein [Acidobacteriota bacterium]